MTEPMWLAVVASFLAGSFGYVLFQFWLRPVLRYRRVKRRVDKALNATITGGPAGGKAHGGGAPRREAVRRLAADLSACHNEQLPDWYQLLLKRRREFPLDAAARLMKLADTRNPDHAARQTAAVRELLRLGSR